MSRRSHHEFAWIQASDFEWNDDVLSGTPCRIQLCTSIYPQKEEGFPYKPASILTFYDTSWSFFSVIKYWIPIKVLGLRFADLVLCPAFALQGLCRVFGTSQKNWWFGTWNLENSGDFGWTSVLIPDINIVDAFSGDWPREITSLTMETAQIWPV